MQREGKLPVLPFSIDVFNKSGWMEATRYGKGRPSEPDAYAPKLQRQQEQAGLPPNAAVQQRQAPRYGPKAAQAAKTAQHTNDH